MKENVVDVLVYLFQNYMSDSTGVQSDRDSVQHELLEAGFPGHEITQAFDWLEGLTVQQEYAVTNNERSFRVYTAQESTKLDSECQGYLLFLEQTGILNAQTRELIIDRVMALHADDFDLQQLKWVILLVLFNRPGQEEAYAWMEDMVFDEAISDYLH